VLANWNGVKYASKNSRAAFHVEIVEPLRRRARPAPGGLLRETAAILSQRGRRAEQRIVLPARHLLPAHRSQAASRALSGDDRCAGRRRQVPGLARASAARSEQDSPL